VSAPSSQARSVDSAIKALLDFRQYDRRARRDDTRRKILVGARREDARRAREAAKEKTKERGPHSQSRKRSRRTASGDRKAEWV